MHLMSKSMHLMSKSLSCQMILNPLLRPRHCLFHPGQMKLHKISSRSGDFFLEQVFGTLSREENYQQSLILGTISVEEFQSSLSKTWDPFNVYTLMNSADLKPFPEPPEGAFFPFFDS